MQLSVITSAEVEQRCYWISEIRKLSGNFGNDFARLNAELTNEIQHGGLASLLSHLRLSGAIPETYEHDSSEEKLYSKYTDALLAQAFIKIGLTSIVLEERADSADVESVDANYSFIADAKAFRLSRTAKNQKDFKVEAMHGWKRGKPFAIVVCPVYQLPTRGSQIYQQAIARTVCILSYSHLAVLARLSEVAGPAVSITALHDVLRATALLPLTKDAVVYWQAINRAMLHAHSSIADIWASEKIAALDSIVIAKEEALTAIAMERERIMRLSRQAALAELVSKNKFDNRERQIRAVCDNGILGIC